jgi:hypothetical protein
MLLSQKYIVAMTHLHLIRDSRWLDYSTSGSTKTLDRLRKGYDNEFTSLNVQQVIGSISCMLKVQEPTAEKFLCLGLRILFKKLTKSNAAFPYADFYGTDRVGVRLGGESYYYPMAQTNGKKPVLHAGARDDSHGPSNRSST